MRYAWFASVCGIHKQFGSWVVAPCERPWGTEYWSRRHSCLVPRCQGLPLTSPESALRSVYGKTIDVMGTFRAMVTFQGATTRETIFVIPNLARNLLSRCLCRVFGILTDVFPGQSQTLSNARPCRPPRSPSVSPPHRSPQQSTSEVDLEATTEVSMSSETESEWQTNQKSVQRSPNFSPDPRPTSLIHQQNFKHLPQQQPVKNPKQVVSNSKCNYKSE